MNVGHLRSVRFAFGMTVLVALLLLGFHVPVKLALIAVALFGIWVTWRAVVRAGVFS